MAGKLFEHWSDVPEWVWEQFENFHPQTDPKLYSPDNGSIIIHFETLARLQVLREELGGPVHVFSYYRSPVYNARVGGAPRSYHMLGQAVDISMAPYTIVEIEQAALRAGFTGFGYYPTKGFIHLDTGPERAWYGTPSDKIAYKAIKQRQQKLDIKLE